MTANLFSASNDCLLSQEDDLRNLAVEEAWRAALHHVHNTLIVDLSTPRNKYFAPAYSNYYWFRRIVNAYQ